MTEEFQPVLVENFSISWPGFVIRRVALNQHMPRVEKLSRHTHDFHQILVYLRGQGIQHLGDDAVSVRRGTALHILPSEEHRFEKQKLVRPVCLAINFEAGSAPDWREKEQISPQDLAAIEKCLVTLHEETKREMVSIQCSALVLQLIAIIDRALRQDRTELEHGPFTARIRALIREALSENPQPAGLAKRLDLSLDHLNRILGEETGMTVGRLIREERFRSACQALRNTDLAIGAIAETVGIDDQNYFARWFRKECGQSPSRWRAAMILEKNSR